MARIAFGIEYDGTEFRGWQRQHGERTVQAVLEAAISSVADDPATVYCAGRTDTGVHATGQVVHFDTHAQRDERSWLLGVNSNLPNDVGVTWVRPVQADFHARYCARGRTYRYLILNQMARPGRWWPQVMWECRSLDHQLMDTAAGYFIGEHDFSAFRAAGCQARSTVRDVRRFTVVRTGDLIDITITANAFLHHMVRNLVGVLLAVGLRKQTPAWAETVLQSRDRRCGGVTAEPRGLYLSKVEYPPEFDLPKPRSLRLAVE